MQWSQWCWTVSCRIWTRSHALQCNAQEPTETVTYWKIFKTCQNNLLWGSPRHHQNSLSFKLCIKLYITPAHLHLFERCIWAEARDVSVCGGRRPPFPEPSARRRHTRRTISVKAIRNALWKNSVSRCNMVQSISHSLSGWIQHLFSWKVSE